MRQRARALSFELSAPYFPPPRPKPTGYRAPAEGAPVIAAEPARVVVQRAEGPPESRPKPSPQALARELVGAIPRERTYWERHRTFARYPRAFGVGLVLLGGALVANDLSVLLLGGHWTERGVMVGPMALLPGLWFVVFGYPLDELGRVPSWYATGLVTCIAVAAVIGGLVLVAMLGASV